MAREDDIRRIVAGGRAKDLSDDQIRAIVARYDERPQTATPPPASATIGMIAPSTMQGDPQGTGTVFGRSFRPEVQTQLQQGDVSAEPIYPNPAGVAKAALSTVGKRVVGPTATAVGSFLEKPIASGGLGAMEGYRQGGAGGAVLGGAFGATSGSAVGKALRKIGTWMSGPKPNIGGRLTPRQTPTVNEALTDAMEATRAPQPTTMTVAPSSPSGGGFTTPQASVNRGGRLTPRQTPTVNEALQDALSSTRSQAPAPIGRMVPRTVRSVSLPPQSPGPSVTMSPRAQAAAAGRAPREGVEVERLYRELARKPIQTPQEQQVFSRLHKIVSARASNVGRSFASGGKSGIP